MSNLHGETSLISRCVSFLILLYYFILSAIIKSRSAIKTNRIFFLKMQANVYGYDQVREFEAAILSTVNKCNWKHWLLQTTETPHWLWADVNWRFFIFFISSGWEQINPMCVSILNLMLHKPFKSMWRKNSNFYNRRSSLILRYEKQYALQIKSVLQSLFNQTTKNSNYFLCLAKPL